MKRSSVIAVIATLIFPPLCVAQGTSTISGFVTDKVSAKSVEGAKVTIIGDKAKADAITDNDGAFVIRLALGIEKGYDSNSYRKGRVQTVRQVASSLFGSSVANPVGDSRSPEPRSSR